MNAIQKFLAMLLAFALAFSGFPVMQAMIPAINGTQANIPAINHTQVKIPTINDTQAKIDAIHAMLAGIHCCGRDNWMNDGCDEDACMNMCLSCNERGGTCKTEHKCHCYC